VPPLVVAISYPVGEVMIMLLVKPDPVIVNV
jgi:hypothetical protein